MEWGGFHVVKACVRAQDSLQRAVYSVNTVGACGLVLCVHCGAVLFSYVLLWIRNRSRRLIYTQRDRSCRFPRSLNLTKSVPPTCSPPLPNPLPSYTCMAFWWKVEMAFSFDTHQPFSSLHVQCGVVVMGAVASGRVKRVRQRDLEMERSTRACEGVVR